MKYGAAGVVQYLREVGHRSSRMPAITLGAVTHRQFASYWVQHECVAGVIILRHAALYQRA